MKPRTAAHFLALFALSAPVQAQNIRVSVNGDPVRFTGMGPQQVQGRVLVPLRGVLEKLGAYVDWVPRTQTVVATKGNMDLQLRLGSRTAFVNGKEVALDVPATTMGGSTMVPLRFVGETLGADVRWDAQSATVMISAPTVGPEERSGLREAVLDPRREPVKPAEPPRRVVPKPIIDRISQDHPSRWLRAGERLTVRLQGTPGAEASFRIPGVVESLPMREVSPGVYEQSWTVPENASLNLSEAPILGTLRAAGGEERDASVVQAPGFVQVDNAAPKIESTNPAPRSEVTRNRPLISATFTDQGGSGIDTNRIRIRLDGRDVTSEAAITPQFFSYTPERPLDGRTHRIDVVVEDRAGNVARESWDFSSPDTPTGRAIEEIRTSAKGEMKPGDVINFSVRGMPGAKAAWSMGNLKNMPLKEARPGVYVGSYRLRDSDDVDRSRVTFTVTEPGGRTYTETSPDPVSVKVGPPESPKITYPGEKDTLTDPLVIRGTGVPGSTVRLKVDYREKVLGVLGVKGTAAQMDVVVRPNGKWESKPIDLGSLLRSRDTELTVSAMAVNSRQQESPLTTQRIK
jgi:hypothetical protein